MSGKIAAAIILSFIISFSIFVYVQSILYDDPSVENDFYSQELDPSKSKILLIGSSYVAMLNATLIESLLQNEIQDIQVFNLSIPGDRPNDRLSEIEEILELEPKIIVYGIGLRAFGSEYYVDNEKILPDPEAISDDFFNSLELDFLKNPKFNTLSVLRDQANLKTESLKKFNTPFFDYTLPMFKINPSLISDKYVPDSWVRQIPTQEKNTQYDSFNEIISIFQQNNIKVIIFITPHNDSTIESLSDNDKKNFEQMILNIEINNDIQIYSLLQNYSKMNVWTSPDHVTLSKDGFIYSKDISNIILKEIDK